MLLADNDPKYRAYAVICHHCPHNERAQITSGPIPQLCKCTITGQWFLDQARRGECPKGLYVLPSDFVARPPLVGVQINYDPFTGRGPDFWKRLHQEKAPTPEWLADFNKSLPCGVCGSHWLEYLKANPPDFGDGWFAWTVAAHNAVNRRLGKPEMTESDARARWLP